MILFNRWQNEAPRLATDLFPMSPSRPPRKKPFHAWKEVKRQARKRAGSPPPTKRQESQRNKPPKHKKRVMEEAEEQT